MSITNILLSIAVIGIAGYLVYYIINKKKTAEVEADVDVDDKTYTIEKIRWNNKS